MSIPKYNSDGFIPIGTHPTTLEVLNTEIAKMDSRRFEIWTKFKKFESQAHASGLFSKFFFFGSFFSIKPVPSDIDVALQFNETNKPASSNLWIFDRKSVKDDYQTDVVFIQPESSSYKKLLPPGLIFSDLIFCRSLSTKEQREWLGKMKTFCPEKVQGMEYKGVLVVPIENGKKHDVLSDYNTNRGSVTATETIDERTT